MVNSESPAEVRVPAARSRSRPSITFAGASTLAAGATLLGLTFFAGPSFSLDNGIPTKETNKRAPLVWSVKRGRRRLGIAGDEKVTEEVPEFDFSGSSCGDILKETSFPDARCAYAQTCNGGDGIFLSSVFCGDPRTMSHVYATCLILSPLLLVYLAVLFRMLGSTAEDYFAPCPEMLSTRLGLPPRFAGASLLALGNGAPDVSAAINSVTSDPKNGYDLALGALTGGGMFVGTVVAGSAIIANSGVPCRGALLRDVMAYSLSILLVVLFFVRGTIDSLAVTCFFLFYGLYASSVLAADLYHRKAVVPREQMKEEKRVLHHQREMWDEEKNLHPFPEDASTDTSDVTSEQSPSTFDQEDEDDSDSDEDEGEVLPLLRDCMNEMTMSNYDATLSTQTLGTPVVLHGPGGILADHCHQHHCHLAPHSREEYTPLSSVGEKQLVVWLGAECCPFTSVENDLILTETDNFHELSAHFRDIWVETFHDESTNLVGKFLMALELPFRVLRKLSIPVPCDGHYCRPTAALSLAFSPLWLGIYAHFEFGANIFMHEGVPYVGLMCIPSFLIGYLVWRYADAREMSVSAAAPIALYGFVMAATWIDFIGDRLVALLQFLGVVLHVPSPVMGLTVLAWGDSMGDLAANIALAKKGLANMAMTACFASPLFNMLIGLGIGFSMIQSSGDGGGGMGGTAVSISPSVRIGFLFLLCNLIAIPICGKLLNNGKIPEKYSYFMFGLYGCYITTSIMVQFMD